MSDIGKLVVDLDIGDGIVIADAIEIMVIDSSTTKSQLRIKCPKDIPIRYVKFMGEEKKTRSKKNDKR